MLHLHIITLHRLIVGAAALRQDVALCKPQKYPCNCCRQSYYQYSI